MSTRASRRSRFVSTYAAVIALPLLIAVPAVARTTAIGSFSPVSGPVGTWVTITGSGFTSVYAVRFGGATASFEVHSATEILARVPAGAATGPITLAGRSGTASSAQPFTVEQPNIVFFLTDDQRRDELSHMPNVQTDLLARGVDLTNGLVSDSLCCPSRTTILTGTYSHTTGIYSNVAKYFGGFRYFRDRTTIATVLHAAGYETGLFGKYLNEYGSTSASYIPPGWDRWFAETSPITFYGPGVSDQGTFVQYPSDVYEADLIGQQAVNFVLTAPPTKPLFLFWTPHAPHDPATPSAAYAGSLAGQVGLDRDPAYNEADVSDKPGYISQRPPITATGEARLQQKVENRFESLRSVDDWIGQIVTALAVTGRLRNTLLVFMSDNGYLLGQHRWVGKVVPYEDSINVPLIVRWDAAGWNAPRSDSHLVANVDLAATWAQAAGTTMPGSEGRSFLSLLNGAPTTWRTSFLLEHAYGAPSTDTEPVPPYCGVRGARYVYVQYATGEEELYDLQSDPYELKNVANAGAYAGVLADMRAQDHALCSPTPPGFSWSH